MDRYLIIIISAAILLLGYFTWHKNRNNKVNTLFFWLTVSVVVWAGSNYLADYYADVIRDTTYSLAFTRLTIASSSVIATIFLFFSVVFTDYSNLKWRRIINYFLLISTSILVISTIFSNYIVLGVSIGQNTVVLYGSYYFLFSAHLITAFLISFYLLYVKYRQSRGVERVRIQYLFIGTLFSVGAAVATNIILPLIDEGIRSSKYGPYFTIIFVIFTAYAIIAYRLFDVRLIVKRTLVYSILLASISAIYSLVIFFSSQFIGGEANFRASSLAPNVIAAILVALGFDPLKKWLSNITDKYLFKGEYETQDVINGLAKVLAGVVNLDEALDSMMQIVTKEMRISKVATLVVRTVENDKKVKWVKSLGYSNVIKLEDRPVDRLLEYFTKKPTTVVYEEVRDVVIHNKSKEELIDVAFEIAGFQSAVAIPLLVDKKLIGVLFVGEKLAGDSFMIHDLETLELVASQTTLSIEKAKFYEEDKLKSEFISIASHELLTPTAAIEGYLSMLLDKDIKPNAKQRSDYLKRAYDSSRRLADLVKDLLSVSRIESGRIKIVPSEIDLLALIKQAVDELQNNAKDKNLKLSIVDPKKPLPKVNADPDRIVQVCINLINNAIKYTPNGEIVVRLELRANHEVVSVTDTGIGISKADQRHLFEKFHRIDNPATAGIMGTGLGLYIVKNIVSLSGGEVNVESEPGKGSTFSFSLPVVK